MSSEEFLKELLETLDVEDLEESIVLKLKSGNRLLLHTRLFLKIVDPSNLNSTFLKDWEKVSKYTTTQTLTAIQTFASVYNVSLPMITSHVGSKDFDLIVHICESYVFAPSIYKPIVKDMWLFFRDWKRLPDNESIIIKTAEETLSEFGGTR